VACREADDYLAPVRHSVLSALCTLQEGACVVTRLLQKDDWLVYAAFLPALLTLVGIGATAAMAWHNQAPWHIATVNAICADRDDVQGLARRGIAKLPGYELSPMDELSSPAAAVAAAELPVRLAC
jgi:hypothetical protein